MSKITEGIQADIMELLQDSSKEGMTRSEIAACLKVHSTSLRVILVEMAVTQKIRQTAGQKIRYWIPSAELLAAETRGRDAPPVFRPLKLDPAKLELYAHLETERRAIRSIG